MGRLDRYLFSTAAIAFLAVLGSLTTLVWLTQVLRRFDLLATQGQSFVSFFTITALSLPMLMLVIAPIALFIAIVFTLNRLSADSELIVISAADIVSNVAIPGRFMTMDRALTFHIRERGPNGLMLGIFVYDARNPEAETTYIAERGRITQSDDTTFLILDQGLMQRRQGDTKSPSFVEFQRYAFDMSQLSSGPTVFYRASDRSLYDLIYVDAKDDVYKQDPGRFRAELHKRLSSPLLPIAGFILAFAFLGEARTTRQNRGLAIGGAALTFGIVQILGFGTQGMIAKNASLVWISYVVPLAGIIYGLLVIAGYAQFKVPNFLQQFADLVAARFERLKTA
jgi:lipopolysaccharide export system permease protein